MTEARKLAIAGSMFSIPFWLFLMGWMGYCLVDTKQMVLLFPMTIGLVALRPMYKLLQGARKKNEQKM